ncbi:hypothetical protein LTR70_008886 [Exophiala xenobiotica]|uniref:Secreted protein n=1 Tax=Lithohypha guttulata TaxID=1690604 RepID=A0ABR0JZJ5_9EURO|nr:hypothetical protein LTR24_008597 [Lithohypha guttulata]KAK5311293.1 hypothetical protein LTR70_008886 [Exophiala xenobiotica]
MLNRLSILLSHLLLYATVVSASNNTFSSNATGTSEQWKVTEPWCIFNVNFVTNSFAMVIPYDGSKDKDGLDKAGHCGEKYKKKSPLKGIALTEWDCHYGPYESACITFNTALLPEPETNVAGVYKSVVGKKVTCMDTDDTHVVCPALFTD